MQQKKKTNIKLNFLKGIACISVVFIHFTFPGQIGQIIDYASKYAVPVFLMITGYYAYGSKSETIGHRAFKLFRMLCIGYFLFFAVNFAGALVRNQGHDWLNTYFSWKTPVEYLIFCTIEFALPLWYLIAMIESYFVWYFVVKHKKEQAVLKLLPVLFLFRAILDFCCDIMHMPWIFTINFAASALNWFLLGYVLRTDKMDNFRNTKAFNLILMTIIGLVFVIAPVLFNLSFTFSIAGLLPYSLGLFTLFLRNENQSICKSIEYIGEKLSLYIYILHCPIDFVLGFFCKQILGFDLTTPFWGWIWPVVILLSSIFASWIIYQFQKSITKHKLNSFSPSH